MFVGIFFLIDNDEKNTVEISDGQGASETLSTNPAFTAFYPHEQTKRWICYKYLI